MKMRKKRKKKKMGQRMNIMRTLEKLIGKDGILITRMIILAK
jgi:hypothetical protein